MTPHAPHAPHDLPAMIELQAGRPLSEVAPLLERAVHLRAVGLRVLAFYLADMDRRGLHQEVGHPTAAHYAEARLELSERRARELIAVGRTLFELPATDEAFLDGRLSWSKLVLLTRVATPPHEAAWIERAERLSCRALKLEVRLAEPGSAPRRDGDRKGLPEIRFDVHARVDAITHRKLELAREKLSAERGAPIDVATLMGLLADLVLSTDDDGSIPGRERIDGSLYRIVVHHGAPPEDDVRTGEAQQTHRDDALLALETSEGRVPLGDDAACLLCDGACSDADGAASDAAREGHHTSKRIDRPTPPALRQRVLARDGHACRHCDSRRGLMVHHIHFRSRGGRTKASNLITLCTHCHALVHADLLVLEGDHATKIRFGDASAHTAGDGLTADSATRRPRPHAMLSILPPRSARAGSATDGSATDGSAPITPTPSAPVPFDEAFREIVGQEARLQRLRRAVDAAAIAQKPLPHVLFTGAAGSGKTTFARALARASGAAIVSACGPTLRDVPSLDVLFARLPAGGVLFLDEIHAVPRAVLEHLYDAMTEHRLTVLAATTELGELPPALRSRFDLIESFAFHDVEDLAAIAARHASKRGHALSSGAAEAVAACARGTPREVLRLTRRVLDFALTEAGPAGRKATCIRAADVRRALAEHGFDADGLGTLERRYLAALRASGTPVALERLGILLGVGARTLRTCVEPFLAHRGLVRITRQGRVAA